MRWLIMLLRTVVYPVRKPAGRQDLMGMYFNESNGRALRKANRERA